ncbi:hypothetical protein DPV78_010354 [Talaromyces pinophilus]|nr:hypothetical protein DPV78_010354 [Talaromyces pinophilus]
MDTEKKSMDQDAEHSISNSRPSSHYYTPYIDIELQFDPLQADPLLQKSLVLGHSDDSDNQSDNLEGDATFTDTDNEYRYRYAYGHHHHNRHRHGYGYGYGYQRLSMMSTTATMTASNSLNKRKFVPAAAADLSDATSDTSGRFDDADESDMQLEPAPVVAVAAAAAVVVEEVEDSKSVHSAKRGRSNGWPLQSEIAYDENGMKIDLSARHNTPTPTRGKSRSRASPVLRIRRSRFIEGSMNDRVSEKPPSIYFQDDRRQTNGEDMGQSYTQGPSQGASTENKKLEKRSSGIFRFGKAIASAFHPFGGSKPSNNKPEQDSVAKQKEIMKQRQLKAEKAYAELKKSGYKGTVINPNVHFKNQVDAGIADETWKSIQEKMGYKLPDESRISQDDTLVGVPGDGLGPMSPPDRGVSKLKSFSELRKRTSNLSVPALRFRDVSPMSMRSSMERDVEQDNNVHQPVERRQSRKELHKQAKLLKRVSNLEDKLERARRELREYVPDGNNQMPIPTICVDDEHDRQYGPGTLPTLLSERLLEAGYVQGGMQGTSQRTTKWPPADSLSRKRRSPVPTPIGAVDDTDDVEEYDADCGKPAVDDEGKPRLRNKLKSARDKRASSLTTKASQRLKAKQSSRNLRAVANATTPTKEEGNFLQEQEGNTSTTTTTPTPSAQKKSKAWTHYGSDYENIPPVPPVPKELLGSKSPSNPPSKEKNVLSTIKARIPSKEFSWPEDIF